MTNLCSYETRMCSDKHKTNYFSKIFAESKYYIYNNVIINGQYNIRLYSVIREFMIHDALKEDAPGNSELLRPLFFWTFRL